MKLALLLQLASLTYLGLAAAGALMPRTVRLGEHLAVLPPFIRQLFWTYYCFIGLCLVSFGLGTFFFAGELASGTPLSKAVCVFLAAFWTVRLFVAHAVFDLRPYLTTPWHKLGLFLANVVFALLPFIYAWTAWKGGRL